MKLLHKLQANLKSLVLLMLLANGMVLWGQLERAAPTVAPIPPSAFQYIKYGEIPVSEYTGIPNISVPLYSIKLDNQEFPISMSYHAGGVRVADEASWVGLGWNLNIGNITQIINDRDDLGKTEKLLPDYYYYPYPFEFPWYCPGWPSCGIPVSQDVLNFPKSVGISKDKPYQSMVIYTNAYIPINGLYIKNETFFNISTNGYDRIDSEPDVFKASFFNHYIEFIQDFKTGSYIILNKSNYLINKSLNASGKIIWRITTPDGLQYFFDEINEILNAYSLHSDNGVTSSTQDDTQPYSRVWQLTKIVTPNSQQVIFKYDFTTSTNNIASFSQKDKYVTFASRSNLKAAGSYCITPHKVINGYQLDGEQSIVRKDYNVFKSQGHIISYLSSIEFPQGKIVFSKSGRDDKIGDLKLDKVVVYNLFSSIIKQVDLFYSYFIGQDYGGGCTHKDFGNYYKDKTDTEFRYRLKLDQLRIVGQNAYQFVYNSTVLPSKTSYATDYWGFFNGKTSNTSFIPNPMDICKETLGSNGNDHKPYLEAAKAGQLEQIIYPTGGKTIFDYELNVFDNNALYNNINQGSGLRVKSITNWIGSNFVSKKVYTYSGGKLMIPLDFSAVIAYSKFLYPFLEEYNCTYVSGSNCYSSSMLGSGQYIGYDVVSVASTDNSNNSYGKIISYYQNHPDITLHAINQDFSVPSRKNDFYPENGLVAAQVVYNVNNDTLRFTNNKYTHKMSDIFFGAKVTSSNSLVAEDVDFGSAPSECIRVDGQQDLVGFYPLYGLQSFLDYSETTDYTNEGKVYSKSTYSYTDNDLVRNVNTINSKGESVTEASNYPFDYTNSSYSTLRAKNMLEHPIERSKYLNGSTKYFMQETYNGVNVSKISERFDGSSSMQEKINYEYDEVGNVIRYNKPDGVYTSVLWGYNNTLPTALFSNESYITHCAYSSFELPFASTNLGFSDGKWTAVSGSTWLIKSGANEAKEGKSCLAYAYSDGAYLETNGLMAAGKYKISFYSQALNSAVASSIVLSGTSGASGTFTNNTDGSWKLVEAEITIGTGNYLTTRVALNNAKIDRLQLYPSSAQSTTYTHLPLVGITSQTDANGLATSYEYDTMCRLVRIRDNDKNLVKEFDYSVKQGVNFNGFELTNLSYAGATNVRVYIGYSTNYTITLPSWMSLISKDETGFNVSISSNYNDVGRSGAVILTEPSGAVTIQASQGFSSFTLNSTRFYSSEANGVSTDFSYLICSTVKTNQYYLLTWAASAGTVSVYICSSSKPGVEVLVMTKNSLENHLAGSCSSLCPFLSSFTSGNIFFRIKKYNSSGVLTSTTDSPSIMYAGN